MSFSFIWDELIGVDIIRYWLNEARELPSDGESIELSLWNQRKKNRKINKWGMGMVCFSKGFWGT
jgi:hypothetical protein